MKRTRRLCRVCQEVRDKTEFYKGNYQCKECKKAIRNRRRATKRSIVTIYLGKYCTVCNKKGNTSHEVHGTPHKDLLNTTDDIIIENCKSGNFAKVCMSCHKKAHLPLPIFLHYSDS